MPQQQGAGNAVAHNNLLPPGMSKEQVTQIYKVSLGQEYFTVAFADHRCRDIRP